MKYFFANACREPQNPFETTRITVRGQKSTLCIDEIDRPQPKGSLVLPIQDEPKDMRKFIKQNSTALAAVGALLASTLPAAALVFHA